MQKLHYLNPWINRVRVSRYNQCIHKGKIGGLLILDGRKLWIEYELKWIWWRELKLREAIRR